MLHVVNIREGSDMAREYIQAHVGWILTGSDGGGELLQF